MCGVMPGPDPVGADWHTGHDAVVLLTHAAAGDGCCAPCLRAAYALV